MSRRLPIAFFLLVAVLSSCGGGKGAATGTQLPTTSTSPAVTTTTQTINPPAVPGTGLPVPLPSMAVGPGGIQYRGGGADLELTGPSLMAIGSRGDIHILDPVGLQIHSFTDQGSSSIELRSLDILGVTAVDAGPDYLVLVEVHFGPERQRVHLVSFDGLVLETIDLPGGFRLEDGLSGVRAGSENAIFLEFEGGIRFGRWTPPSTTFERSDTLAVGDTVIQARPPDLAIDGLTLAADLVGELGGLRYLGTATDGTHMIARDDVVTNSPRFEVLSTIEWYSPGGKLLGSALIPSLDDQHISQPPGVAVSADGRAFALVARADVVNVVELPRQPRRILKRAG